MRIHSIKTCSEDDEEDLVGLQLILGIEGTNKTTELESFGNMTGDCNVAELDYANAFELKASGDSRGSGVNDIKIRYGNSKIRVGTTDKDDYKQW